MKSDAIIGAVQSVTKKWTKQRKAEERSASAEANRSYVFRRRDTYTIRDAVFNFMEEAYLKASANGTLPAHARQIMYAIRPFVMDAADRRIGNRFDQYFSQQLLPDYMEENDVDWNVVFDARGRFHEPHTKREVPLGTLEVREYLDDIGTYVVGDPQFNIWEKRHPTAGPENRYGAILFIEKEGFMPLFRAVNLAARYDIAIMSTKGMSVTASRELVDRLCGEHKIPLLVLHDFDKAGFSIAGTMRRDTRRYSFVNDIEVFDLGLRIEDIDGLEIEAAAIPAKSRYSARSNLRLNGATTEEIEFLLDNRVELNAFTSDALVAWIERKLQDHGVSKVVPADEVLTSAYRRAVRQSRVQRRINVLLEEMGEEDAEAIKAPKGLRGSVQTALQLTPDLTWDGYVRKCAALDVAADTHDDGPDGEAE